MNKKSIGYFCVAISCLVAGAACHGFRTSGDPVKFKIGVIAGILMIISAISFAIAGIIVAVKEKKSKEVKTVMKPQTALELLSKYVQGETLLRHCKTVGVAMRYFAEKYGEDADYWESVGILHDIDFEQHPDAHCVACVKIFEDEKANFPEIEDQIVHAVQSHGFGLCCDVKPAHKMEKVLFAVDELTGLIFACAMARPSKSVMDMELKSVTKKFKDKAFAAGCSRDVIRQGAEMMGVELNDLIQDCILAMRSQHEVCGC